MSKIHNGNVHKRQRINMNNAPTKELFYPISPPPPPGAGLVLVNPENLPKIRTKHERENDELREIQEAANARFRIENPNALLDKYFYKDKFGIKTPVKWEKQPLQNYSPYSHTPPGEHADCEAEGCTWAGYKKKSKRKTKKTTNKKNKKKSKRKTKKTTKRKTRARR